VNRRLLIAGMFLLSGALLNVALMWWLWLSLEKTYPILASHEPALGGLLPYEPNWILFIAFAVVIGIGLFSVVYGPLVLRRSFRRSTRRQHGLCPACGYPMRDSSVCSECGEALPKRSGA
jgi:hypothetical protein